MLVSVSSWQQQCCGEDFAVGSAVRWQVVELAGFREQMESLLGPNSPGEIRYYENHHRTSGSGRELLGTVRSIRVLTYELEPIPGDERGVRPKQGTGGLEWVHAADKWAPERSLDRDHGFGGWIVEVEPADEDRPPG